MHNIVQKVHTNNLHLCTYHIFVCISLALCCGIINSVLSHFVLYFAHFIVNDRLICRYLNAML